MSGLSRRSGGRWREDGLRSGERPRLTERIAMGQTSRKLHNKLTKMAAPLDLPTGKLKGRADMPSIETWIREGMDPVHAAYAFVQHISSSFAEGVSRLPEMRK